MMLYFLLWKLIFLIIFLSHGIFLGILYFFVSDIIYYILKFEFDFTFKKLIWFYIINYGVFLVPYLTIPKENLYMFMIPYLIINIILIVFLNQIEERIPQEIHIEYTVSDEDLCPICLEEFPNVRFMCGHYVHSDYYCMKWSVLKKICPLCRQSVLRFQQ